MSTGTAIREAREALRELSGSLSQRDPGEINRILTVVRTLQEEPITTKDVTPQFMLKNSLRLYPMSQLVLARRLGISKSVVSDLVNGRRTITVRWARRLGKILGLHYKAFL